MRQGFLGLAPALPAEWRAWLDRANDDRRRLAERVLASTAAEWQLALGDTVRRRKADLLGVDRPLRIR